MLFLTLAAAGSIFGLFLLSSLHLQNVLGMGPIATGLTFIPSRWQQRSARTQPVTSSAATAYAARSPAH